MNERDDRGPNVRRSTRRVVAAVGAAVRPVAGETLAGDAHVVIPSERGVLVALADGLGHGPRAADAAEAFLACVAAHRMRPLEEIFMRAHRALASTRGAVAGIARFDEEAGRAETGALGNITIFASEGGKPLTHRPATPGIVGSAYRSVRTTTAAFGVGDVVVLHSDGVRLRPDLASLRAMSPQAAALDMLRLGARPSDDASCVIVRGVAVAVAAESRDREPAAPPLAPLAPLAPRRIPIRTDADASSGAVEARAFAREAGFGPRAQWEISIAVAELATNVVKFAMSGELAIRWVAEARAHLEIVVSDRGAGIADVAAAEADGWSEGARLTPERPRREGQGLGVGLGSVRRMMDEVRIDSAPGQGTRVVAFKYR